VANLLTSKSLGARYYPLFSIHCSQTQAKNFSFFDWIGDDDSYNLPNRQSTRQNRYKTTRVTINFDLNLNECFLSLKCYFETIRD
jgi:hypothetical protein